MARWLRGEEVAIVTVPKATVRIAANIEKETWLPCYPVISTEWSASPVAITVPAAAAVRTRGRCRSRQPPLHLAGGAEPLLLEQENVLHADDVGECSVSSVMWVMHVVPVAPCAGLHDDVDRCGNLRADRLRRDAYLAVMAMVSRRASASRGVLEWIVVSEPS